MTLYKINYFNPTIKFYLELKIRKFIKQLFLWIKSIIKRLLKNGVTNL